MFYDLNVAWSPNDPELQRTLHFQHELGYDAIVLSHTISGKLPGDLTAPIPELLSFDIPPKMQLYRRCTLVLSDTSQNHRLSSLASNYDILALRPTNEKALQQACATPECDIISIDMTQRLDYHFKMKMLAQAIENGIKFEICYGAGVIATEAHARRNLISNATQLIRATRGRGIIISSEATRASACRAPYDVINLAHVWGLPQERAKEAVTTLARNALVTSQLKRTGYRGTVSVVSEARLPSLVDPNIQQERTDDRKRKADSSAVTDTEQELTPAKPLSKRQAKKQRAMAREAHHAMDTQ